jgi:hypothetical protein
MVGLADKPMENSSNGRDKVVFLREVHPEDEWWRQTTLGWFFRYRGIVAAVVIHNVFGAAIWIIGQPIVASYVGIIGVVVGYVLWLERKNRLSNMLADDELHSLTHEIRDRVNKIQSLEPSQRGAETIHFHQHIVDKIAAYFRHRVRDPSVSCCIRLAENTDGAIQYVTAARASGLVQERKEYTVPISSNEGIAKAFLEKKCNGSFLIRDLKMAVEAGIWKPMENDKFEDARFFLVCPINGWQRGKRTMIGILFITSRKNTLAPGHWLPQKAIADLLGLVYPMIYSPETVCLRQVNDAWYG